MKTSTGSTTGLGLICLMPFLGNPLFMYLWDALTPVVFYVMLMISLALANLLWRVALNKAPVSPSSEAHTSLLSESEGEAAMEFAADKVRVHIEAPKFSAWYFVVSEALGVLNFWNFGVTLSSLAFWSQQTQTGTNFQYIEALPWILYEDGWTLRKPSLPFLILITAGTPISWVLLFTRFRNEIGTTHVTNLIGGLYHTYRQPVFYWEFVVLVRRLLIAALVRLPATNVFRHWMVVVVLLVALVLQYRFHPYKDVAGNWTEVTALCVVLLSFCTQQFLMLTPSHATALVWICIVINALFFLGFFDVFIYGCVRTPIEQAPHDLPQSSGHDLKRDSLPEDE